MAYWLTYRLARQRLAQSRAARFNLMAEANARAIAGVMAIVHETFSISHAASCPICNAALDGTLW
jgi:hypothetical protein